MITTLLISLREFLEVFLIIGVFLGLSRKLSIKREKEIILASVLGISIALLFPTLVFILGEKTGLILNQKNSELLKGYLMIFSGFFIAYVIFSLHNFLVMKRAKTIITAHQKLQQKIFDLSLFFTIVFFIFREGFEIALFTATTSLFSKFVENMIGLILGFIISANLGLATFFVYLKIPLTKVFRLTEYLIIILGAAFVKNGLTQILKIYFNIQLSKIIPIPLIFLPDKSSFLGHLIKNLFGLEQQFSLAKLTIMIIYFLLIYQFFLYRRYPTPKK